MARFILVMNYKEAMVQLAHSLLYSKVNFNRYPKFSIISPLDKGTGEFFVQEFGKDSRYHYFHISRNDQQDFCNIFAPI